MGEEPNIILIESPGEPEVGIPASRIIIKNYLLLTNETKERVFFILKEAFEEILDMPVNVSMIQSSGPDSLESLPTSFIQIGKTILNIRLIQEVVYTPSSVKIYFTGNTRHLTFVENEAVALMRYFFKLKTQKKSGFIFIEDRIINIRNVQFITKDPLERNSREIGICFQGTETDDYFLDCGDNMNVINLNKEVNNG